MLYKTHVGREHTFIDLKIIIKFNYNAAIQ
jgi:hypothetical protein